MTVTTQLGDYTLEGIIGQGASGTVYRAIHRQSGRRVAIKMLAPGLAAQPAVVASFMSEARLTASLQSEHCVRMIELVNQPGAIGLVSELVEGATLQAVLAKQGRLSPEQAVGVVHGALQGLADLHRAGIVHRDVKPSNIVVDARGCSLLADFGLAQAAAGGRGSAGMAGSPTYMSPEQALGEATTASDVYSCGAMLYELLTGQPPYPRESARAVLDAHRDERVPDPRSVVPYLPAPVAELVMTSMDKDPARRPPSAEEFARRLEVAAAQGLGLDWRGRAGMAAAVTAVLAAGGVVGAGIFGTTAGAAATGATGATAGATAAGATAAGATAAGASAAGASAAARAPAAAAAPRMMRRANTARLLAAASAHPIAAVVVAAAVVTGASLGGVAVFSGGHSMVENASPGYGSPQAAAAGFIDGAAVQNMTGACAYVLPSQQQDCLAGTALFTFGMNITGSLLITKVDVQGNEALVAFVGNLCTPASSTGPPCMSNHDPTFGLPGPGESFQSAYSQAVNNNSNGWSAISCQFVNGRWYVDAGM